MYNLRYYHPNFLKNLSLLRLQDCYFRDPMGLLEKLPNLERLFFRCSFYADGIIYCQKTGFPRLRYFSLEGAFYLKKWEMEEGGMPNLNCLKIRMCRDLKRVPFVPSLKEVVIEGMSLEVRNWMIQNRFHRVESVVVKD
ncbi:OLC1v1019643C1 [Oldenlandia corymbosa var. corymbosa]|uniref:OLC1v1019643C1 n=1 Tax=Oldenlandia corymbosa var. corymbosa TaxID=529605 RepID=A0AAV1EEP1_OLDCO|nr:OLC1v1019643C1 [Oldenlandia corymbosa var. corymbosa]